MSLRLTLLDAAGADRESLVAFLTRNAFPFHVRVRPTAAEVHEAIDAGAWGDETTESLWIDDDERGRVGLMRLDDLADATAMVDLRLAEAWRGHGLGARALSAAVDRVFRERPAVIRFEGQTREDNHAMRRTFDRCGWVQEAYYRDGWPVDGAEPVASVAYSVLRRDWTGHEGGRARVSDARTPRDFPDARAAVVTAPAVTVRTAVFPRDTDVVSALVGAYLRQTEREKVERGLTAADAPLPERYAREIAEPATAFRDSRVLIASVGAEDCGMVVVATSPTATDISRLWTTPRARGHGVGATLVAAAVDGAVPPVRLSVWDWREPATRLYRRFGFEPVPSWDDRAGLVCLERR
ncbi:GNAT family N-acetyltransferase [Microbacterium trichothecenolyticum]|uniref:RimJ/RimL family protein N-acetyltransferase n=1 Tax=Microbacterium trichothecenolyticum TaxID=69370 RepID=A0ABU0TYM2_MICTR|nr:GNAT family N-acetyltransferase [Microbacterium trichothecenolyticum]MDQ1124760.1 RimJ/RimL family protein N-acetyltransferase [Microbacterium trichothecenolyticum]